MIQRSFIHRHGSHISRAVRPALIIVIFMVATQAAIAGTPGVFNIREYGAAGDA